MSNFLSQFIKIVHANRGYMKPLISIAILMIISLLSAGFLSPALGEDTQKEEIVMTVSQGKQVSIEYTLKLEGERVVDSNVNGDPFTFIVGEKQMLPGLEAALNVLKVGDSKKVKLMPEQAYGPVHQKAVVNVPIERLPVGLRETGKQIQMQSQDGQKHRGVVREVGKDSATIDFNHPLAGKTLLFDIKVLAVENQ
jgi:FKBP-type peptidyl-prolyl cis-trans isomerase SlyD